MASRCRGEDAAGAIVADRGGMDDRVESAGIDLLCHRRLQVIECAVGQAVERRLPTVSGCDVRRVTAWPRRCASSAMAAPVRPVKTLVIARTRSIGTRVLPAVMRMFMNST